jgi:hypothetical protein
VARAPPQTATLKVSTQPRGAHVYLEDEPKGTTSTQEGRLVLKDLAPGSYRLRLSLDGYNDWSQTVAVKAGETVSIEAQLAPWGPQPFSAQDVVDMLVGSISPKRMATLVQKHGVDFVLTDEIEKRIRAAGGDAELLVVIAKGKK